MLRYLFVFCSAASLLLCAVVFVLWVRSGWVYDRALWTHYRRTPGGGAAGDVVDAESRDGRLWLRVQRGRLGRAAGIFGDGYYRQADATGGRPRLEVSQVRPEVADFLFPVNTGPVPGTSGWGPVRWQSSGQVPFALPLVEQSVRVGVSHWALAAVLVVMPAWHGAWGVMKRRRRWERIWAGLCVACGYDLRGSPGRCPECGEAAVRVAA